MLTACTAGCGFSGCYLSCGLEATYGGQSRGGWPQQSKCLELHTTLACWLTPAWYLIGAVTKGLVTFGLISILTPRLQVLLWVNTTALSTLRLEDWHCLMVWGQLITDTVNLNCIRPASIDCSIDIKQWLTVLLDAGTLSLTDLLRFNARQSCSETILETTLHPKNIRITEVYPLPLLWAPTKYKRVI